MYALHEEAPGIEFSYDLAYLSIWLLPWAHSSQWTDHTCYGPLYGQVHGIDTLPIHNWFHMAYLLNKPDSVRLQHISHLPFPLLNSATLTATIAISLRSSSVYSSPIQSSIFCETLTTKSYHLLCVRFETLDSVTSGF
ncbi:hypothetical protein L1887_05815 [Cichorium endivia]|nr:hypothetical protein L1887_05815 [Cichorium endivia]